MKEAFEKIVERLEEETKEYDERIERRKGACYFDETENMKKLDDRAKGIEQAISIVHEVAEEYNNSQINQLAMMYATSLMLYGVDMTKELETATQQSYALEQAYIRGRQCERDKFAELRKEYNNGWIPCSERLPEEGKRYLVSVIWKDKDFEKSAVYDAVYGNDGLWHSHNYEPVSYIVIAWQPLPEPYQPEGE